MKPLINFAMMCGLPASGKSTWAKEFAKRIEGNVHSSDELRKELIDRFNAKNGFKNHHAHMYRHTYATMLFEQGINPKVIQKLMGHRDINTTLKIYNSINKENISSAIELIEPKVNA